jgi:hypothetical protein
MAVLPMKFTDLCAMYRVTPEEQKALAICLAVLRATQALKLSAGFHGLPTGLAEANAELDAAEIEQTTIVKPKP